MASEVNFTLDQGSTFSLSCTYKDSNGNPVNLTGYSARSQARETIEASTTLWNNAYDTCHHHSQLHAWKNLLL
jgi:hypothetical protein